MNLNNRVQLIGIIVNEPVIKTFGAGSKVARFTVETTDVYKQGEKLVKETLRHNVVAWGSLAEMVSNSLSKSSEIALEGKLMRRSYTDHRGDTQYITEVVLTTIVQSSFMKDLSIKTKIA
ncbi:MAG: single-stranded DNA-binding protein [Bacteroidota bacterium]|jgi:single-strand DNA-binding protein|nr:single-stranded DNA-binding protein [Bacteroidales bacterium]MDI9534798.1 single-stranded DNA-binding protein [Bacteroidota bacterium]OQC44233.1 MAG: Single-stranded DNA-binding protein [Bacteroidetes bacterium ADurb.Bin028]NLP20360.1 single-stranded DNA-binding protein [Bacteroidales bacterium]HOE38776.1 single-stranded DNA-binding protein [Bacteroidales bacterium]